MHQHINDLTIALEHHKWHIIAQETGNDHDISAIWHIAHRHFPQRKISLIFEGMGDLSALPIEQSYACHLQENPKIHLYFTKNNRQQWQHDLAIFIENLFQFIQQQTS